MNKVYLIFISLLLSLNTTNAYSKIVYIDINLILNKSEIGEKLNNHLQEINNQNIQKFKKIEEDLIIKEELLLSQKNILEKKEFEKRLSVLSQKIQDYRSKKKVIIEELNQIKIINTKKILEILNPIISNFVEKNEISLVMPKKNIIVGKKKLDITEKIIFLLNDKNISLSF